MHAMRDKRQASANVKETAGETFRICTATCQNMVYICFRQERLHIASNRKGFWARGTKNKSEKRHDPCNKIGTCLVQRCQPPPPPFQWSWVRQGPPSPVVVVLWLGCGG